MKIILKLTFTFFILILLIVSYLSIIGIETKKFNNQIQSKIKELDKNLNIELKDIKIILNPLKFNLSLKTIGPKVFYKDKFLEIENIKSSISLKSFFEDKFFIELLNISTKSIEIDDLISFSRSFYQKPELIILEKFLNVKGFLIADISLKFDSKGNLENNFIIKGFVKDAKLNLSKNHKVEKLNFVFDVSKDFFVIEDLKLNVNKINFNSKKIIASKFEDRFKIEGNFKNDYSTLDENSIIYFKKFLSPSVILKKINFSSNNKFSLNLNKNFELGQTNLSSKIKIKDAIIIYKKNFKEIFPGIKDEINFFDHEINFDYKKNFSSINGKGDIIFQKKKEFISYKFENNNNDFIFENLLKIKHSSFLLDFLNFEKKSSTDTIIKLSGKKNIKGNLLIKSFSLNEGNNNIEIKNLIVDKNNIINQFDNISLNYFDKDDQKNSININKNNKDYVLKGETFNADNLIENLLINTTKSKFFINDLKIKINIKKVRMDSEYQLNSLKGELIFKNQKLFSGNLSGDFPENKKLNFAVRSKDNNKVTTFTIDHAKPIVKRYKFVKGFEGGILDFYSTKKLNESNSQLKIYDFKLKELPVLTKILTLASLQGIADILSGEGIGFDAFEMNFKNNANLMTIEEIYAIGPAISILMEGYVEKGDLISLRGTLVPATTINKFIGSLPVLGKILVGSKTGEGVFGVSFKIKGPPKKLETSVNPIKTLTPRFITRTLEKLKKN